MNATSFVCALSASVVLCACSTPQPARDLAMQGAVMADKAQSEVNGFIDRAGQAYQRREAIVRELARGEIQDVSAAEFRAFVASKAGRGKDQQSIDLINELADKSRESRERVEAAFAALEQKLGEATGPAAQTNATNLAEARKAFIVLSQELTPAEWLAFTQVYIKQVQQDLQTLQAAGK